jgi:hypothetical protein
MGADGSDVMLGADDAGVFVARADAENNARGRTR